MKTIQVNFYIILVTQKPTTAVPRKMLEKKEVRTEKL